MVYNTTSNITAVSRGGDDFPSFRKWPITMELGLKITAYSTVLFLSMLGNFLICLVAKQSKSARMKTANNYFLVSLCVSNMFLTICFVPGIIKQLSIGCNSWPAAGILGLVLCKAKIFTGNLAMAMSFLTTVALSFNWHFAVFFPWKKHWQKEIFYLLFFLAWFGSVGYSAPVLYMSELRKIHGVLFCTLTTNKLTGWTTYRFIMLGIIPLAVVIVVNTSVMIKLKIRKKPGNQIASGRQERKDRSTEKAFRLILAVIVVFYVCFFPYWLRVIDSIYFRTPAISGSKIYAFTAIFLAYFNGAISPWILFSFNRNYNVGLRNFLGCRDRGISASLGQETKGGVKETCREDGSLNTIPLG